MPQQKLKDLKSDIDYRPDPESLKNMSDGQVQLMLSLELRRLAHKLGDLIDLVGVLMEWKTGGKDPNKGIDIRMDRVERTLSIMNRVVWIVIGTVIPLIIAVLWGVVRGDLK